MLDEKTGLEIAETARTHTRICPSCHKRFEKKFIATIYCGQCESDHGKSVRPK